MAPQAVQTWLAGLLRALAQASWAAQAGLALGLGRPILGRLAGRPVCWPVAKTWVTLGDGTILGGTCDLEFRAVGNPRGLQLPPLSQILTGI